VLSGNHIYIVSAPVAECFNKNGKVENTRNNETRPLSNMCTVIDRLGVSIPMDKIIEKEFL
jgi:hypothetical protein